MLKLPMEQVRRFVPGADPEKTKDFILKACEYYQKVLVHQREPDDRHICRNGRRIVSWMQHSPHV